MTESNSSGRVPIRFEQNEDSSVMATGMTEWGRNVLVVTAPASSIDGGTGPVLIAGDLMDDVIVVYSDEYIESMIPTSEQDVPMSIAKVTSAISIGVTMGMEYLRGQNQ